MKIIKVDNFDREGPGFDDKLVCENINEFYGKEFVNFLNTRFSGETSPDFYKLVPDNHKLYKFEI